jgi:hypothetical protein
MRLPRVRFTVRRLMAAVAAVAVGLASYEAGRRWSSHRRRCLTAVAGHQWAAEMFRARLRNNASAFYPTAADLRWANRRAEYHERMERKWAQAATRPWESVAPDPPEPD